MLGQEVTLDKKTDIILGGCTALAQRRGDVIKVEQVLMEDAPAYAEARRRLFRGTAGVPSHQIRGEEVDLRERLGAVRPVVVPDLAAKEEAAAVGGDT